MHPKAYSVPTMNPSNSPDGDLNTSEHVPSTPEQVPSSPDPIPISVEETAKPKYTLKGLLFCHNHMHVFCCSYFKFFI